MDRKNCFVLMPFDEALLPRFELFRRAATRAGLNASRIDHGHRASGDVIEQVAAGIGEADLIIADLIGSNPNVFYELGVAHAMGRRVLLVTDDIERLPFDVKGQRVHAVTRCDEAEEARLTEAIASLLDAYDVVAPVYRELVGIDVVGESLWSPRLRAFAVDALLLAPFVALALFAPKAVVGAAEEEMSNAEMFAMLGGYLTLVVPGMAWDATVGQRVCGIKTVDADGKASPRWKHTLRPIAFYFVSVCTFGMGPFLALRGPRFQALHDRAMGMVVVRRTSPRRSK